MIPIIMLYTGERSTSILTTFVTIGFADILIFLARKNLQGYSFKLRYQELIAQVEFQLKEGDSRKLIIVLANLKNLVYVEISNAKGVFRKAHLVQSLQATCKSKADEWIAKIEAILSDSKSRINDALQVQSPLEAKTELEECTPWVDCLETLDKNVYGYREYEGSMRNTILKQKVELEARAKAELEAANKQKAEFEAKLRAELEDVKVLDAEGHDVEASRRLREITAKARVYGFNDIIETTTGMIARIRAEGKQELQEELLSIKHQLVGKIKAGDFEAVSSDLNRFADIATREEMTDIASGAKDLLSQLDIVENVLRVLRDRHAATVDDLCSEIGKPRAAIITTLIDWSASLGFVIENGFVKVNPVDITKLVEFIDSQFDAWARIEHSKDAKKI